MARFSSVWPAALLLAAAAAAQGERRPSAVPPHYFDRATPPLTVRHRPPRPAPPPYAVPMEPLLPYSQPDPLYHRPEPASELQTLRKSGGAPDAPDAEAAATADEPAPGPGPAPDALFPDSDAQPQHLPPPLAYGPPYPERLYYVREPEPIIEIIIKESNESLPAAPTTPRPPPKKEPVHVFYVKYKKDPTKYGKESVVYEAPVPAVTPATTETAAVDSHAYGPPPAHVTAAPPPTTTLRTIIRPDSETYHGSGLRVTFGGPHEDDSEVPSESAQRPSLALPQPAFQGGAPFQGHFPPGHGPHKREHGFFQPPPPPSPPSAPRPGPPSGPPSFPPSAFQQPQGSFSAPHRHFPGPPTPFLRQLPAQAQPFAPPPPPPPQRPPPQPFHGPQQPPKLRPQPQFGHQPPFQRPAHSPQQPPPFRPAPSASFPPPPPPPPPHGRTPQNQQYIEQQRKVIQQQQAELFQQQQQQQQVQQQPHILQQLQQQRHQLQLQHQQQLQQQHLQQQRLQQHQHVLPQIQAQPPQHQTAQQLGFNGEIVKSVPQLEEHLTTRERPSPHPPSPHPASPHPASPHPASPHPGQQLLSPAASTSHAHGLGQPGPSFAQPPQTEAHKPTTFSLQQSISQPSQAQFQQHQQFQTHVPQQPHQLIPQPPPKQHPHQLPVVSQAPQTPLSRPFSAAQSVRRPLPPTLPSPTTKPPKVFSLVPSSTASPPTTTTAAVPTTAAEDKDKPLPALPDEVPEDLRQQLLSSGILSNADIQVLDYDKVGDIPIENLPPEALENFYGAGSAPVPAVVSPNATVRPPPAKPGPAPAPKPGPAPVEMKVVRYDAATAAGQQLAEQYVRADATQVDPVVLNDAGYNRYLPLKVSGVGFPLPDVPELRGRNVTSVVILAPVDYDLLQQGEAPAPTADADTAPAADDDDDDADADRAGRAAAIQVKGVRFVTGDILKDLVKNPTGENYRRWLERERAASAEQQAIILLVAEGDASGGSAKEIFMYDAGSRRVSKLSGKLSAAFVDVAEANASSQDIDNISAASPHIMELRHRGSLDDVSAEGAEAAESRRPAPAVSITGGYSKTSAVSS